MTPGDLANPNPNPNPEPNLNPNANPNPNPDLGDFWLQDAFILKFEAAGHGRPV